MYRDIETYLHAHQHKLYHMGNRSRVVHSTLSDATEQRDWHIYADFAQALIRIARPSYAEKDPGLELDNTVYAFDASTIDLCLSVKCPLELCRLKVAKYSPMNG